MRTAKHWSRLTKEIVQVLSSEAFKARVNKALSKLVQGGDPCFGQDLGLETS